MDLNYHCGDSSGHGTPWDRKPTRDACVQAFLATARNHFKGPKQGTQATAQRAMWRKLDPAVTFIEPTAVKKRG